ncbi:MAG TPA: M15 family metallopeptidase [Rhizomicrobium sp.]|jgi:hypothetical protein
MASDTGDSNSTQDSGTYDPNQPISVLGNLPMPSQWSLAGTDSSQPSILGSARNPKPWTPADNSLNFFVDPETMKTIDFGGDNELGQGGSMSSEQNQPSPDGTPTQAGEYELQGLGKTYLEPQFADQVGILIQKAQGQNIPLQFTSGYRDPAQQAALKNDPNAITPADQSLHSAGRSVDVNWKALSPADRATVLDDASAAGLSWGGNFHRPDPVHFYSDPGTDRRQLIDSFSRSVAALRNQIPDR